MAPIYETTPAETIIHARRLLLHGYGRLLRARHWEEEDVVQDVLLLTVRHPYDPGRSAVSTWLTLLVRAAVSARAELEDRQKRQGGTVQLHDAEGALCDAAERAVDDTEPDVDEATLESLLSHIRKRHPKAGDRMAAIIRGRLAGMTLDEIAQAQGCTRQRIHQLLRDIRAATGRWLDGLPPRGLRKSLSLNE